MTEAEELKDRWKKLNTDIADFVRSDVADEGMDKEANKVFGIVLETSASWIMAAAKCLPDASVLGPEALKGQKDFLTTFALKVIVLVDPDLAEFVDSMMKAKEKARQSGVS
jgi:hypothetical protein